MKKQSGGNVVMSVKKGKRKTDGGWKKCLGDTEEDPLPEDVKLEGKFGDSSSRTYVGEVIRSGKQI